MDRRNPSEMFSHVSPASWVSHTPPARRTHVECERTFGDSGDRSDPSSAIGSDEAVFQGLIEARVVDHVSGVAFVLARGGCGTHGGEQSKG